MSHLPLTCEFVICELDIKPPVVSRETLNFFRGEAHFSNKLSTILWYVQLKTCTTWF